MPAVYDSEDEDETYGGSYTPRGTSARDQGSRSTRQRSTSTFNPDQRRSLRVTTGGTTTTNSATPMASDDDDDDNEQDDDDQDDDDEDDDDDDQNEDDDEPAEINDSDLDPINSGQATPALSDNVRRSKAINFHKRKELETKVIKGHVYTISNDELMLDDDPRGDAKVDALGNLLGGRQYKTKAFTSSMRPNPKKLYMFSIDTARAAGFRDSLYFFRRHPTVHKITIGQAEKDKLIAEGKLSLSMKSRIVTMVTARNVFKVLGAEFIKNGKYVFDDYCQLEERFWCASTSTAQADPLRPLSPRTTDENKALAEGHQPGEQASNDPPELAEAETAAANASASTAAPATTTTTTSTSTSTKRSAPRDEYISIAGGGTTFGGIGLQPFAKTWDPTAKKARPPAHLNTEIWMLEYAKAVRRQDAELSNIRRANVGQVHLNPSGLIGDREEDAWIDVEEDVPSDVETVEERMHDDTKRRRRVRVYNPLRGIYEPETNIPHVWKQTQATRSKTMVVDELPHLWEDEADRQEPKRRRIESEAAKLGIATIETVVEEVGTLRRIGEDLLPGMWVFRTAELANGDVSRGTK